MLLNVDKELKRFIAENAPEGEFEPIAYYDEVGDFICVLMKDCSYTESKADVIFAIFKENSTGHNPVGFTIEGSRKCLQIIGLPQQGKLKLSEILRKISGHDRLDTLCRIHAAELIAFLSLNECMGMEIEMPS